MNYIHLPVLFFVFICTAHQDQYYSFVPAEKNHPQTKEAIVSYCLPTKAAARANFSGKWKLNGSKSETGQFGVGKRTCLNWLSASKTLQIAAYDQFLTVDLVTASNDGTLMPRQEKLTFDGKQNEVAFLGSISKKSTVRWSLDGEIMYVSSVINYPGLEIKTLEIWKIVNDGNSISIETNSTANFGRNITKLVYDKVE